VLGGSEPGFLLDLVGLHKLFVGLGQVDDALDKSDEATCATGEDRNHDPDDAAFGIPKDETVDAKSAQKYSQNTGYDFLAFYRRGLAHVRLLIQGWLQS
jgi:hypothetical protein